jgi:hypothetical protein
MNVSHDFFFKSPPKTRFVYNNGDLDRFTFRPVYRSIVYPQKEYTKTHKYPCIPAHQSKKSTSSEFLITRGNISGESQWYPRPLETRIAKRN